jgi:hypothetical protein
MGIHAIKPNDRGPEPCDVIDTCPICGGSVEAVYTRVHQKVCVCEDCHTTITVPATAWQLKSDRRR